MGNFFSRFPETIGEAMLKVWVRENGPTATKAAKIIGVSDRTLSNWLCGQCVPGEIWREKLEVICGIEQKKWTEMK